MTRHHCSEVTGMTKLASGHDENKEKYVVYKNAWNLVCNVCPNEDCGEKHCPAATHTSSSF
eukprot:3499565-Amphidinium_carterae.1